MQVQSIEDLLDGSTLVELRCLVPDRQPYVAMLLQPDGPIEGSLVRVGHQDQARGASVCRAFLQKCVEKHADLAIAPEYCVPWSLAAAIGDAGSVLRPAQGAIWILGFESVARAELEQALMLLRDAGNLVVSEELDGAQWQHKAYVDPLMYVFWCKRPDGSSVLAIAVQYKTTPCRDNLDVEQRSLCVGTRVYTFNRGPNRIGLLTIICSDAFAFNEVLVNEYHSNMLLVHIQLNSKPSHTDYARYRRQLLSIASTKDVELICLNWSGPIVERTTEGKHKSWDNNAGSAFYAPPSKFSAKDELVIAAHHEGLYYSIVDRWHGLYINQCPQAILLQKQKAMLHAQPQAVAPTSCATVMERWIWDPDGSNFRQSAAIEDGFAQILVPYKNVEAQLKALVQQSPLAVERALEMLVGTANGTEGWYHLDKLESMRVGNSEAIRRVTVNQDFDPTSEGPAFRKQRLQRAHDAVTLPGNGVPWPPPLKELESGFSLTWKVQEPHHNIAAMNSGYGAGLVYLADQADDVEVKRAYDSMVVPSMSHAMKQAVQRGIDPSDAATRSRDRLCVVFRRDNKFRVWGVERMSKIDADIGAPPFDIAGEQA